MSIESSQVKFERLEAGGNAKLLRELTYADLPVIEGVTWKQVEPVHLRGIPGSHPESMVFFATVDTDKIGKPIERNGYKITFYDSPEMIPATERVKRAGNEGPRI